MTTHKANPEHWQLLEEYAGINCYSDACLLELRARIEALEAANPGCPHIAARRPKPLSLKEQALAVLESVAVHELYGNATADNRLSADDMRTIRLALEALPDD